MLERLRVRNFRGFENLGVDRLRRINLVAGRNDTGKSTLLEAIFLLGSAANPRLAVNSYVVRSKGVELAGRESMAETLLEAALLRAEYGRCDLDFRPAFADRRSRADDSAGPACHDGGSARR